MNFGACSIPLHAEPVIAAADLVLSTLSLGGPAASPPPFDVGALSAAPGSGSAMEDWLASVVAGGDGGMEGESQSAEAAAGDEEAEEEDELLVPGAGVIGCCANARRAWVVRSPLCLRRCKHG